MVSSVLGSVILGYRPLWNPQRALAAVQLFVTPRQEGVLDVARLLPALSEYVDASRLPLMLSPPSAPILAELLDHTPRTAHWIEVRSDWAQHPAIAQRVQRAHQRGLRLVWRGDANQHPDQDISRCFVTRLLRLSAQEALYALQSAARQRAGQPALMHSPVQAKLLYEGVASRLLADHCLDQQQAGALLGWPDDDVLHALQHKAIAPDHAVMQQLLKAVDDDRSMETIEALLAEEPILTFRFLAYANSASVGLRNDIDSLRHGLMMLGYTQLRRWLNEQMSQGSRDPNLRPVKAAMVLRARLMESLMDAGVEHGLAREIYLCGLFSQIDVLMGEPLGSALHRIPLPSRIYDATVRNSGPYAPLLQIASALESDNTSAIRSLSRDHGIGCEDINRALLRTLSGRTAPN